MKLTSPFAFVIAAMLSIYGTAFAAAEKPNILFIMGDDIGILNVGVYHRGLMVGETPNIDRLAQDCLYQTDAE